MKKAASMFLVLALCLSLSLPAFGAEDKVHTFPDGSTVTLTNVFAEETITWDFGSGDNAGDNTYGNSNAQSNMGGTVTYSHPVFPVYTIPASGAELSIVLAGEGSGDIEWYADMENLKSGSYESISGFLYGFAGDTEKQTITPDWAAYEGSVLIPKLVFYIGGEEYAFAIRFSDESAVEPAVGVTVKGTSVVWTDAAPFIDANDRTMVPLRAVGDALGLTVDWDGTKREAIFTNGTKTIYFPIDSSTGETRTMDTAAVIVNDRTYAPVRYLAEFFGYAVDWDGVTRTVMIQESAEPSGKQQNTDLSLPHAYTTRFQAVNLVTYPPFLFDYPDGWTVSKEEVTAVTETVELKNARGVTVTYWQISGPISGGGSAVSMLRVEVSKVADSQFVPGSVQGAEHSDLGKFMVAKLKITGTMDPRTDINFTDIDGSVFYAVLPESAIGTREYVNRAFNAEFSFDYSSHISFIASAPQGGFTAAEEAEVIAVLSSFRVA